MDFMRPFPPSNGKLFILLAVDYVSKWVEAVACASSDAKVVAKFLHKHIFTRFGTPRALISDEGSHFINKVVASLLAKYNIKHKVSTTYHPQPNGHAEISNWEIKSISENDVNANRKHWAMKLDDAIWAYCTAFKTPLGDVRRLQLLELEKFHRDTYDNAKLYKEKTKQWHDARINPRKFEKGQQVLLFNSRLKLLPGKLKSRCPGPFLVSHVFLHGAVKVQEMDSGREFTVNGQRLKHFFGGSVVRDAGAHHFATY
ncbi:uncharacterized protein LOC111023021 [Momordica charantia]|uniref:Uncharacterized protein LOC111023021 n=1 Tax=Momordica charantia TaxID=3673 RepID=A0A6J1DR08_MOMCH|nr:uncharacterized protein LOC111023021 [Momordica charantia]